MSLTEIKSAIESLSEREKCELAAWLQNWQPDDWDRQMQADAERGKLDELIGEAEDAYRRGECRPFP
jgi:hypothetical protein